MPMARRLSLILNPQAAAGQAPRQWEYLFARLRARGTEVEQVVTRGPGHGIALAQERAAGCEVVVAVGGDGTANEVATGLLRAGSGAAALGLVPLGTGNDAAHQLGIADVAQAVNVLTAGEPRAVDAIRVEYPGPGGAPHRHYALLFAAVGFAGDLIRHTTPRVKRYFGQRLSYSVGFFRALRRFRAPWMRLHADAREFSGHFFHVCAGNAEFGGGGMMRLSPGARMDDGLLNLCLIRAMRRLETLRCFPRLLRGTHVTHPKATYFSGRCLRVETDPPVELQLDGDLVGTTPATFRVEPAALRVLR